MLHKIQTSYRRSIKWSFAGSLASAGIQLAQMVIFARLAGPVASGDFALAAAIMGFLTPVAEAGLAQSIVHSKSISRRLLRQLTYTNLVLSGLICLLLWLFSPIIGQWYGSTTLSALLCIMGGTLLFTPIGAERMALLTRDMQFEALAKIDVTGWALSLATTTVLAWQGWGALAMALGFLVRNGVTTLSAIALQPRVGEDQEMDLGIGTHLRFGFFDLSSRWAEFFANYLDKLVVGKWLGLAALGYYQLAFSFLMLPTAKIGYVITRVTFPVYARIRAHQAELQAFFVQSNREIIQILFPMYAGLAIFSQEITLLVFGTPWLPVAPLLVAFGVAGLVRTLCAPFPQLMRGLGQPQIWLLWLIVFTAVLNVALFVMLWLNPSAEMAAWSRAAVKVAIELPMLWWLACRVNLTWTPVLKFAAQYLLLLLPMIGVTILIGYLIKAFWWALALKAVVFGGGMLALWWKNPFQVWPPSAVLPEITATAPTDHEYIS